MRKLSVIVLLVLVSLQGIEAAHSMLQCAPTEAGAAHAYGDDNGTAEQRGNETGGKFFEHLSCHQLSSGMPAVPTATAAPVSSDLQPSIPTVSSQFFPEQPQRPPFAASF